MKIEPNQEFSHATLNPFHLLERALPYVDDEPLLTVLSDEIRTVIRIEGDAFELWYETVLPYLEGLAPEGCAFGSLEGDSSCLGWWQVEGGE